MSRRRGGTSSEPVRPHVALCHPPVTIADAITGQPPIIDHALPLRVTMLKLRADQTRLIGDATSLRMHGGLWFRSIRSISAQTYARSRSHRRVKEGRALHIFPCASTPGTRPGRGKEVPGRLQTGCGVGRARGAKWHKNDHAMVISRSQTCRYG